jgi:hypothetical protein
MLLGYDNHIRSLKRKLAPVAAKDKKYLIPHRSG